jgi:hypothetical protein
LRLCDKNIKPQRAQRIFRKGRNKTERQPSRPFRKIAVTDVYSKKTQRDFAPLSVNKKVSNK